MHVGRYLRQRGFTGPIGFSLHRPVPTCDAWDALSRRDDLLDALLSHDLVGLQTEGDLDKLRRAIEKFRPFAAWQIHDRIRAALSGSRDGLVKIYDGAHRCRVGVFPIGIDTASLSHDINSRSVDAAVTQLRRWLGNRQLLLSVDDLEPAAGILQRLEAYRELLERRPDLHGSVVFRQLVDPGAAPGEHQNALRARIAANVDEINHRFAKRSWLPVDYRCAPIDRDELLANYRAARVMVAAPLRHYLGASARELCASQLDREGVLVLGRCAASAADLGEHAVMVDAHRSESLVAGLECALGMPIAERMRRMNAMRRAVHQWDATRWASSFLDALQRPPSAGLSSRAS
jgi:trehalose 6-phosphate synthase